ncbi:MAG: hypothetical protein KDA75_16925 [Planctomycetaceae bacterium]|nr:hypothetical protein [Planctomycetaceae bacterium]
MIVLDVAFRLIHVVTAIVLLGGSIYLRFVLIPSAAELPDAEHDALRGRLRARWKKVVMIGILLLLVSGFYNYLQVAAPAHKGQGKYHMLMGIKILLAMGVFFLASVLTGRSAKFEAMRRSPAKWLTLLIALALMVVGLGSVLKVAVPGSPPLVPPGQTAPE